MVRKIFGHVHLALIGILILLWSIPLTSANPARPAEYDRLTKKTQEDVKLTIAPLIEKYCGAYCELIGVAVDLDEDVTVAEDMGFESAVDRVPDLIVRKVSADVQIDDRIGQENRTRLAKILSLHMRRYALEGSVNWLGVKMPKISGSKESEEMLDEIAAHEADNFGSAAATTSAAAVTAPVKNDTAPPIKQNPASVQRIKTGLSERVMQVLTGVINQYCPNQCLIERVDVIGALISPADAQGLSGTQYVTDSQTDALFKIDRIDVDVTMDAKIDAAGRDQILRMMQAKTRFASPIYINAGVTDFPETYAQKLQKTTMDDPYGLEKLRQMLTMFHDLASTKEIITNTKTTSENNSNSKDSSTNSSLNSSTNNSQATNNTNHTATNTNSTESKSTLATTNSSSESVRKSDTTSAQMQTQTEKGFGSLSMGEIAAYAGGLILLIGLLILAILRFGRASRDANEMTDFANPKYFRPSSPGAPAMAREGTESTNPGGPSPYSDGLVTNMKISEIKNELTEMFMQNPKVARETFGRYLKEDGVEATAKYLQIFGYMIIFELLNDPGLQRELYELSEYYHNSNFNFTTAEEYDLLCKLKTRVTASEIRVLTQKSSEKFEFLQKLDAGQIYSLISEEKTQVQSIVLTQLDRKRRRALFDMYQGDKKVELMEQLSAAEAIPKEYLYNVAKALAKKVSVRPEFDTENLRSSDVLMDLLEKADLEDQVKLMSTLQKNNPDTARSLKLKLITVEVMPFLKDGHLLELVLGIDREDLLMFLAGTKGHIRDLLVRKAPDELADSWTEDLEHMGVVDETSYKVAEMKILGRIRNLAHNGTINLLDINERIFASANSDFQRGNERITPLTRAAIAA